MSTLLERMANDNALKCPACKNDSLFNQMGARDGLICSACNSFFVFKSGVPIFFSDYTRVPGTVEIPQNFVKSMTQKLSLPNTAEVYKKIEEAYRETFMTTKCPFIDAEVNELLDRFGITPPDTLPSKDSRSPTKVNCDYEIEYERHYIESTLPAGKTLYRNVRVKNNGKYPWSSLSTPPLALSCRWLDGNGPIKAWGVEKTSFPITIEPSKAITLPLKINTPPNHGNYTLEIFLHHGNSILSGKSFTLPVRVEAAAKPFYNIDSTGKNLDYQSDHLLGREILSKFLHDSYSGQNCRLLEIGGGPHPQAAYLRIPGDIEAAVVNVDVSLPLLLLGTLFASHHNKNYPDHLCFVCCDANYPPFKNQYFDIALMFSTLHHFPDPEKLLSTTAGLVKEDGFIAVMCEPVGNSLGTKAIIRDLSKGINEQIFSLEEYFNIFEKAGLKPVFSQIDGASLKTILKKART
ncbi:MAG: class I SAM-dependent methyltransferase [Desulfocucumaceae bacterium]